MNNKLTKRIIPIMLAIMVGLTFSFAIMKTDVSALSKPAQVKALTVKHDDKYPERAVLNWKKINKRVTGYKVYRSTKKTKSYKCIATRKGKSNITYTDKDTNLCYNGKTYYYKVRAYYKKGSKTVYGKYSAVKSFKNPKIAVSFNFAGFDENKNMILNMENGTEISCYMDSVLTVYYYDQYFAQYYSGGDMQDIPYTWYREKNYICPSMIAGQSRPATFKFKEDGYYGGVPFDGSEAYLIEWQLGLDDGAVGENTHYRVVWDKNHGSRVYPYQNN